MEGRGRSRARRKRKLFSSKRLTSFLLAAAMIGTNVGADLNTAYAAGFSSEVAFEMRGSDLVTAIEDAIATGNTVTPDDLDFTNGKVEQFEGYLFGEGKLYEAYPEVEGGDVSADLRVFVRLPEDGDDMYAVTGDEEVIFLYVNNSSDTVKFRSCINYMVDGEEKVKKTDWVTVRSYESAYGDEEVNVISDPVEPPVTEAPEETEGPANDTETTAPDGETTAPETPETDAPAGETPDSGEGGETDVPETDVPGNDPLATDSELTLSMSQNVVSLVAMPGDELATPSDMTDGSEDEEETTAPEETTGSEEETTAAEETTGSEEETTAAEETTTAPAEEETTAAGETETPEDPKATESETEKPEVPNAPKPTYSDLVGVGWSGTAKLYSTTLKKLHALDDVEGWPVNYSIAPAGSARIIDGPRGVEDGEDLYFGVKNQIGYAVETVLANGEELTADTVTENNDGSQTVWYNVPEVMEEQDVDVVMTETGEHPAFEQVLTMDDGMEITIRAGEGVLPAGVQAAASVVTGIEDVVKENVEAEAAAAGEEKEVITSLSYNIDLLDADGNKLDDQIWNGVVEVTFSGAPMEEHSKDADSVEVVYVETTKESEPQAEIQAEDVVSVETVSKTVDVAEGDSVTEVSFETEHFSVYTVTFYSGNKSTDLTVYVMDTATKHELQNKKVSLSGGYYSDGDVIQIANLAETIRTNMGLSADEYPFLSATTGNDLTGTAVNVLYAHKENGYNANLRLYRTRERQSFMGYSWYEYHNPVNTLYFWYGEPSVTVTFDKNNGGGTAPDAMTAKAGEFITLPGQGDMTAPNNCVFSGWSRITNPNENGKYKPGNNGTVYPAGYQFKVPENDITLYAVWSQKNVDAEFYIRLDGVIPTEPQGHKESEYTSAIKIDGAIKIGTFYTNATVPGVVDRLNANAVPTNEQIQAVCSAKHVQYNPDEDYVLWYVIKKESTWHVDGVVLKKAKVNLSYDPNGKTFVEWTMPDGMQYDPGSTAEISSKVPQNEEGYHFVGWNTKADGTGTAYDPNDSFTITEDTTLYAQWAANTNTQYTVEFYYQSNGRYGTTTDIRKTYTGTTGATAVVSEADKIPTEPGYVFDANASNVLQDTISGDGSLVLKVYFKQQFTVTISGDSHVQSSSVTDSVVGWNGSSTGNWLLASGYELDQVIVNGVETTVSEDSDSITVTEIQQDTAIYVKTKAQDQTYAVQHIDEDTGTVLKTSANKPAKYGDVIIGDEQAETIPGYTFVKADNLTVGINNDANIVKVYYSKDENGPDGKPDGVPDKLQYRITYNRNAETATGTTEDTHIYEVNHDVPVAENGYTNVGYTFTGWNTEADGSGTRYAEGSTIKMVEGGLTLYAQWEISNYTLTVEHVYQNADSTSETVMDALSGEKAVHTLVKTVKKDREGYAFANRITYEVENSKETVTYTDRDGLMFRMPAGNVKVTYYYKLKTYNLNVEHVYRNADGTKETVTDDLSGTVVYDTLIQTEKKDRKGHRFANLITYEVDDQEKKVSFTNQDALTFRMPDGDVKVTYYYDIDSYQLDVEHVYQNADGTKKTVTDALSGPVVYDELVQTEKKDQEGYTFANRITYETDGQEDVVTYTDQDALMFRMPTGNVKVTYYYDIDSYQLDVVHAYRNADGTVSEVTDSVSGETVFDTLIQTEKKDREGYVFANFITYEVDDREDPFTFTNKNALTFRMPAGNVKVTYYYDIESYQLDVEHVYRNADGTEEVVPDALSGEKVYDTLIQTGKKDREGYAFANQITYEANDQEEMVTFTDQDGLTFRMPTGNVKVTYYYDIESYQLDVEHVYRNADGTEEVVPDALSGEKVYDTLIQTGKKDREGYAFANQITYEANDQEEMVTFTDQDGLTFRMPTGNVKVTYYYDIESYQLDVEHVYRNADGTEEVVPDALSGEKAYNTLIQTEKRDQEGYAFANLITYEVDDQEKTVTYTDQDALMFRMPTGNVKVTYYYDTDENGDDVPDKYQTTVVFAAVNGTVDGATQVEKVVTLTDSDGNWSETGSYTLTEEDIPKAVAATGYAQSTKEWDVNPVGAVIDTDKDTKVTFVVTFSPADQTYIVQYIDEDTNEGLKEQDTFGAKFGDYINGADHAIAFEGYAFTHATELWVTDDNQTNYVFVYYSKDEKGEDGPDDIPDKYQLVFTYQSADPNTGEVTGKTVEVYNFIDTPIEPTYPAANVTAAPAANYAFDYWVVEGKEDDPDYTRDMTFLKQTAYDTDTTFVAYFDTDEIGKEDPEKPDGVPDKYQIKFTYETEDSTHGTIDGASAAVEVVDRPRNSDGSYDMEKGVSPSVNVTVDALGRYRFENWTDEAGNTYSTSQLQAATFTADATFTAHFRYVSGNGNGSGGGSSSGSGGNPYNPDAPGPGTVMIDDDNVPLAPLPQQEGESFVIDEDSVPLAPLPKTGQQSSRIPVTMLLTGIFLALASLTRRREEES